MVHSDDIEDLRSEKIIAFSRQNLSYSERYFSEMFETHGLTGNIASATTPSRWCRSSRQALASALHRNGRRIFRTATSSSGPCVASI